VFCLFKELPDQERSNTIRGNDSGRRNTPEIWADGYSHVTRASWESHRVWILFISTCRSLHVQLPRIGFLCYLLIYLQIERGRGLNFQSPRNKHRWTKSCVFHVRSNTRRSHSRLREKCINLTNYLHFLRNPCKEFTYGEGRTPAWFNILNPKPLTCSLDASGYDPYFRRDHKRGFRLMFL
jgi:hypothetical protein